MTKQSQEEKELMDGVRRQGPGLYTPQVDRSTGRIVDYIYSPSRIKRKHQDRSKYKPGR